MKKYGFTATVFIITSTIKDYHQVYDATKVQMLSEFDLPEMRDVFTLGSHTHEAHKYIDKKPALKAISKLRIKEDLNRSKDILNTDLIAYPYGAYNQKVTSVVKEAGFNLAFTTKEDYVTLETNPLSIPRFSILQKDDFNKFKEIFK